MKTVGQILIVVLIVAGIIGGLLFFTKNDAPTNEHTHSTPTFFQQTIDHVGIYTEKIKNGWSDEYLTTIKVYVAGRGQFLDQQQIDLVNERVGYTFLNALDELIQNCYGQHMVSGAYSDNAKLTHAYQGLRKVAADYPHIKISTTWDSLIQLKSAHEQIYDFGRKSHPRSPRLQPKIQWNDNVPQLKYGTIFNFASYGVRQENMRKTLLTKRSNFAKLKGSPWTNQALSKSKLEEAVNDAANAYRIAEQRSIDAFAAQIMTDVQRHVDNYGRFSKEQGTAFLHSLDNFIAFLSREGYSTSSLKSSRNSYYEKFVK